MILQKGGVGAPDARALPPDHAYARLIERFVDDNAAHERRLERDRDRGARTSGRSPWRGDRARGSLSRRHDAAAIRPRPWGVGNVVDY